MRVDQPLFPHKNTKDDGVPAMLPCLLLLRSQYSTQRIVLGDCSMLGMSFVRNRDWYFITMTGSKYDIHKVSGRHKESKTW
jgi:hypothetical protein